MRKFNLFFLILLLTGFVFGDKFKAATFLDLLRPKTIEVDKEQIYITDGTTVYIYSKKDFSLVKKFGKRGEGPQEFTIIPPNVNLRVMIQPDHILVNSMGKLSFFTKKGEYIKEIKHSIAMGTGMLFPMENQYAAFDFAQVDKKFFLTSNIYDSNLKKVREIMRIEVPLRGQRYKALEKALFMHATRDKIFISGEKDFVIDVFDKTGKKLFSINQKYELLKFTDAHKEEALNYFKTHPDFKQYYEVIKNFFQFPDEFQAIRNFFASDQRLYVQTFLIKNGQTEFYIFDFNGKFLKKVWLPIALTLPLEQFQLFTIYNEKLYQLIENEEEEEWELHITEIK